MNVSFAQGTYPAIYQSEEDNPCTEMRPSSDEQEAPLDPNHTHFLLVDTGMSHLKGKESAFRAQFERFISRWQVREIRFATANCTLIIE